MPSDSTTHAYDVDRDHDADRFAFGANWGRFARTISDQQTRVARQSLADMLGDRAITGKTFLDVGSGSGLFSLAAVELGATHVSSFDYDLDSVQTTRLLKERHASGSAWTIMQGSALDPDFMNRLGTFEIVYSWGVLHHTGNMWRALDLTIATVAPGGLLFISIYNDRGRPSRRWRHIKRLYNRLPDSLRTPYVVLAMLPSELGVMLRHLLRLKIGAYVRLWRPGGGRPRGMSRWHDMVDWVGGYPFEVAKPEEIFTFCADRGLRMLQMTTCGGGAGCNQFVFVREA